MKKRNIILLVLVLLLGVGLGIFVWQTQRAADNEVVEGAGTSLHADHTSEYIEYNGQQYRLKRRFSSILLIGTDSSEVRPKAVVESGNYNYQFADFLAVLVFDHDAKTVTPFQINRDTVCKVPWLTSKGKEEGYGIMQITYAHTFGQGKEDSCENTVQAVRWLLYNAPIDRYMAFTMDAVPVMNDLVGGVTVTLEDDDFAELSPRLRKGETITLTDEEAELLVHTRMTVGDGTNEARMRRQAVYLKGATKNLRALLGDQSSAEALLNQMESFFTTKTARVIRFILILKAMHCRRRTRRLFHGTEKTSGNC